MFVEALGVLGIYVCVCVCMCMCANPCVYIERDTTLFFAELYVFVEALRELGMYVCMYSHVYIHKHSHTYIHYIVLCSAVCKTSTNINKIRITSSEAPLFGTN